MTYAKCCENCVQDGLCLFQDNDDVESCEYFKEKMGSAHKT